VLLVTQAPAAVVAITNEYSGLYGTHPAVGYSGSFTTAGVAYNLNSVDVLTRIIGGLGGGSTTFTGYLFANDADSPGSLLATSAISSTISVAANDNHVDFVNLNFGSYELSTYTTYWLMTDVSSLSGTANPKIYYTESSVELSSVGWTIGELGYTGSSIPYIPVFRVIATQVPEPGTYAICSLALLGFTLYRRR
jgi:hypothetical protein